MEPADDLALRILSDAARGRAKLRDCMHAVATKDAAKLAAALVELCDLYGARLVVRRTDPGR